MSLLPVGVGDREEQRVFLHDYASFLEHFPCLKQVAERVFCRKLESPPQSEIDRLLALGNDNAPEVIDFENRIMADRIVFFLGRIALDDFGEVLILVGNGRGIGAYKILRGMYERVVTATFLDANPASARPFALDSDVQKMKLAARLKQVGIDLLGNLSDTEREAMERRAGKAISQRKTVICNRCKQPIVQSEWTLKSLDEMAKVNPHLAGLYGPCYVEPTNHHHATSFGLERRLRALPGGGYEYNVGDYRRESRKALLFAHNLLLQNLALQNARFDLQLDSELQVCVDAFKEIWDSVDKAAHGDQQPA
jgi:hypothetical protein